MIILDGGMGQELVKRAGKATDLWSMQALLDFPASVRAIHDEYFTAGAEIATTNTYSILPDRLMSKGLIEQLVPMTRSACEMALAARDAHGSGQVAGSLGPQGFSYQPDKAPPAEQAAEVYADIARLHAEYVDFHILETMSSIDQARGGLMGAGVTGKPVWVSLSVDDSDGTKLRSGEPLSGAILMLEEFQPATVLINCSVPEAVSQGLPVLAGSGFNLGAYANGFTGIHSDFNSIHATVDLLKSRTDLGPEQYLNFAKTWAEMGASAIGGCCEVGPKHIAMMAKHFGV
ncbi:homocysteine S-methyltransferase family protein [Planktomarina sp.]|jgi:S-methylmethionine-dependent homocysteine/selenocysteine methylase|nr:homocysteine S-methyltransferase family protein [Planktomarina sp.]|tara:strand:- start:1213 stop:2079 length:867 start_codon:yes stop_codon:yes gene_type:complete